MSDKEVTSNWSGTLTLLTVFQETYLQTQPPINLSNLKRAIDAALMGKVIAYPTDSRLLKRCPYLW